VQVPGAPQVIGRWRLAGVVPSGRGRTLVPADVVATVMVLQVHEGLSDREAAIQLRQNSAWKVACGRALTDPGFHPSVLTPRRTRLRGSDRPERIFEVDRQVVQATGVLRARRGGCWTPRCWMTRSPPKTP